MVKDVGGCLVYVSLDMVRVLDEKLDEGWFSWREFVSRFGEERALRLLLDMFCQGLLDRRGENEFVVTDAGRRIVIAWRTSERPEVDPWIDSRVFSMLYACVRAGGRVPEEWRKFLAERGFMGEADELSPEAYEVLEVLEKSSKRVVISRDIALDLIALPDGPAPKVYYHSRWMDTLEAMNLVVKSVPNGEYYALTRTGRILKKAFQDLDLSPENVVVLNRRIFEAIEAVAEGREIDAEIRSLLARIGYITSSGKLTKAGLLVLRAWRYLQNPVETPPTALSDDELALLRAIDSLWRRYEESKNVEDKPTRRRIEDEVGDRWRLKHYTVPLALAQLEALGLVREEVDEDGDQVYRLTDIGRHVMDHAKCGTTAVAVRALIEADVGRSPCEKWIEEARATGLIGSAGPTDFGRAIARASREADRSLLITNLETLILRRLPENRSVRREDIVKSFPNPEEAEVALDKLESKGFIVTNLDERVMLTELGSKLKQALIGVPSGIATPITPAIIKILRAIKELREIDTAEIAKLTRLSIDTVKTALIIARACRFIGAGGAITREGELILEVVETLRNRASLEKE